MLFFLPLPTPFTPTRTLHTRSPRCTHRTPTPSPPPRPPKRPYGYWKSLSNTLSELHLHIASTNPHQRTMPTAAQLTRAGRPDLAGAIRRHTWPLVSAHAGLVLSSISRPRSLNLALATQLKLRSGRMRPYMYWRDFEHVRRELAPLVCVGGVMPTANSLVQAGRSDLVRAIKMHGGWKAVACRMDVSVRGEGMGVFESFGGVEREVRHVMQVVGTQCFPRREQLSIHGRKGLVSAIVRRYGGMRKVAARMHVTYVAERRSRGFWSDEGNLKREVLGCVDVIGGTLMPSATELRRIGRVDVVSAVRRCGGFEKVAALCGLEYVPARRRSAREGGGRV